ncbi:MAG: FAD-dependent oxidoreductase [Ornithinimicrobium sp.]
MTAGPRTSLLLDGAGHAHLYVIAHAHRLAAAGYGLTLLAPADFRYSGMASASAVGALSLDAGRIDIVHLARTHDVHHIDGRLVELDVRAHQATTDTGARLSWDVVSFNIGSVSATGGIEDIEPGVLQVKPLADLATLSARLRQAHIDADQQGRRAAVTIVGGGSSGAELAGQLSARGAVTVRLVEAGPHLVSSVPSSARAYLRRLLSRRGVSIHTDSPVHRLAADHVLLSDGQTWTHDLAVLSTGLRADPLVSQLGLTDTDTDGSPTRAGVASPADSWLTDETPDGIPVSATLQYLGASNVYAAGDCAHFTPSPLPKIGVHGVRQGPVLLDSLIRRAAGAALPTYDPPPHPLQILDLGGGVALAAHGRRWWCGRTSLAAKRWIDKRWLTTYS